MKLATNLVISVLLTVVLVFTGCASKDNTGTPTSTGTPAFTNTPVFTSVFRDISVQEAAELIENNANNARFVILDVRTPEEFAAGHIEGAILLDFYAANFRDELDKLDKAKTYFVYCRSGNRSGQAMGMMEELGFSEVYNLDAGMNDWVAGGLSTVK